MSENDDVTSTNTQYKKLKYFFMIYDGKHRAINDNMKKFNITEGIRISHTDTAKKYIGQVCKANSKGYPEFGRIHYVTPTSIVYERLTQKEDGEFIPHPIALNPTTKNCLKIATRNIKLITITQM
jgi:hypothetical protein